MDEIIVHPGVAKEGALGHKRADYKAHTCRLVAATMGGIDNSH